MDEKKDLFSQMDKNTVRAEGQLKDSKLVRFDHPEGKGKKIMFVGNSITLHGLRPEIGWFGEWGMAASEKEKDYVHLVKAKVKEKDPNAAFCICQVSNWEDRYQNGENTFPLFENARDFGADIIVIRLIENCPKNLFEEETFKTEIKKLLSFLDKEEKARFIITTGFWRHPGDDALRQIAQEINAPLVELGDLGEQDEMKALGLFEHQGICVHPGDKGMAAIAERIFEKTKPLL